MKAEVTSQNPFLVTALALVRTNVSREELVKNNPWHAIQRSLTDADWNACLASIAQKPKGYHASGNNSWEEDAFCILSAHPSAKEADKLLKWYLDSLFARSWGGLPLETRIEQLFAPRADGVKSIAEFSWSAINRHLKDHPHFYWMHPRIRQVFVDRLVKASFPSEHCPGQEIFQNDADNIEQALRRICAVGDVSMLRHIDKLHQALGDGEVNLYLERPDPFAKNMLLGLLNVASKELCSRTNETPESLSGFLARNGILGMQVKVSAEPGDKHSLRYRVAIVEYEHSIHRAPDLSKLSIDLRFEGFQQVAVAETDCSHLLDNPKRMSYDADKPIDLILVPKVLDTGGRLFYGARVGLTLGIGGQEATMYHYHQHDSGPVEKSREVVMVRLPLRKDPLPAGVQ